MGNNLDAAASPPPASAMEEAEAIVLHWGTYGHTQPPDRCVEPERKFLIEGIATALTAAERRGYEQGERKGFFEGWDQCQKVAEAMTKERAYVAERRGYDAAIEKLRMKEPNGDNHWFADWLDANRPKDK